MPVDIRPHRVQVPAADVIELRARLARTRWPRPGALPLVLTHGWPGSVLELVDLVADLRAFFRVVR
ncbi:epoxide hydrolase N-terminal domain-containing protein [Micromonospora sp. NPDC050686]|uniref:epoxide hydrolase N-terminal domain-containing protein n=1 Tax=Micromonospora sp. NPDC050686 TaxID=3154631 RepID=UPI0033E1CBF9